MGWTCCLAGLQAQTDTAAALANASERADAQALCAAQATAARALSQSWAGVDEKAVTLWEGRGRLNTTMDRGIPSQVGLCIAH